MHKVIKKLRPGDYWRIGEHESWFSDMALEGIFLEKVGLHFAKFTKGEPRRMRYRIDVSQGKHITQEQKELYSENGWEYVTSYGEFNVFSSLVEANAPELHTDPAEQAYTLSYLEKKFIKSAVIVAVATVLMIGMLFSVWFLDASPYLALVQGGIIQQAILLVVFLYTASTSLQAAISIRTLRKTLSEGKAINHSAPWRRQHKINLIVSTFFIVIAIFGVILPWMQIAMSKTETLPMANNDLPVVRLGDVERNSELVRESSYTEKNVDWGNRYRYDWSIFAPLQYQSDEQGVIANEMWKDGSGVYSPSIHTSIYKLNFPSMNERVLFDLIKRYGEKYEGGDFLEKDHPGFDKLIIQEGRDFKDVFAAKGKGVVYIRYFGYADIDSVIEATAEKIALISD